MESKCFSSHLYVLSPNCFCLHHLRVGGGKNVKIKVLALASPFWKSVRLILWATFHPQVLVITIQLRRGVKGRVICSPLGIAFGIGKESFIFPGCRGRLFPLRPRYPSKPPVSTFFPFFFLRVGCQRKTLRSGWSGSSKPSASEEVSGSFCQATLSLWLSWALPAWASCAPALPSKRLLVVLCPPAEGKRLYPYVCKMLSRNGLLTEYCLLILPSTAFT